MPLETSHVIVIVDDQKDDIFLFTKRLEKAGVKSRVVPILHGRDAVAFFERAATTGGGIGLPIICFLDVKMPGTGGFDVLEWIRKVPALDPMPVIMLSSSDDSRDVTRAARLGAQCYLVKHPTVTCVRETVKHAALYAGGLATADGALFRFPGNLLRMDPPGHGRQEAVG